MVFAVERENDTKARSLQIPHCNIARLHSCISFARTDVISVGNWNAPVAICISAVIYALRCMVNSDIPLNHGCIKPVELVIPDGSLLKPSYGAAVCAGNVLTSQRIVDVIFRAFEACVACAAAPLQTAVETIECQLN